MLSSLENIRFSFLKWKLNKVLIKTPLLHNNSLLRMLQKFIDWAAIVPTWGFQWVVDFSANDDGEHVSFLLIFRREKAGGGPLVTCLACEQTHLWVTRASGEEQSDPAGRSTFSSRGFAARFRARCYAARACVPTWACSQAITLPDQQLVNSSLSYWISMPYFQGL